MPHIRISGIDINFPFEPYDVQKKYMEKVLESLQQGTNAILESPTGTGKTLCLLCSTLAWLETRKAQHQMILMKVHQSGASNEFESKLVNTLTAGTGIAWGDLDRVVLPKIIYASRTHSQLSQAVQELKRTQYNHMKSVVVGSRDQLCIHPEVMKETNTSAKIHLCRAKVTARTCHYYNGVEAAIAHPCCRQNAVVDIEDLVKLGSKTNCCPYYLSRSLKQEADIIFMPYNYLLDSKSRKAHGIDLSGNIVIFDEAHNVEKMCEESASFELSSQDIALCINEVTQVMQHLHYIETSKGKSFDMTNIDRGTLADFSLSDLVILKTLFCELEGQLEKIVLNGEKGSATFPGSYIFEFLAKIELTVDRKDTILELLDRLIQHMTAGAIGPTARRGSGLQKFADMIKVIFSQNKQNQLCFSKSAPSYKVHISISDNKKNNQRGDLWTSNIKTSKQPRVLNYWCFNPGVGMQNLLEDSPRCVLLTSGTLAPLDTFAHELQIPLPVRLENPHIIQKKQLWVGVISKGPDGTLLSSSYQNRSSTQYISALGNTIVNFARIVPQGLLIFFPSYYLMNECQKIWEQNNIWQAIGKHKTIFMETQIRRDFQQVMDDFYKENDEKSSHGGVFLAVCRGKVSEGLDFADHNGRAVIVTGLPFPPWKDPKVMLKMEYLNELVKQTKRGTNGQDWYRLEASRAVNQAIGRVIRHKDDYGAIILCDSRFGDKSFLSQLSSWLKPHVQNPPNFGSAIKSLTQFFREIKSGANPATSKEPVTQPAAQHANLNNFSLPASRTAPSSAVNGPVSLGANSRLELQENDSHEQMEWNIQQVSYIKTELAVQSPPSRDLFGALEAHQCRQISDRDRSVPANNIVRGLESSVFEDVVPINVRKRKFNVIGPKQAFEASQTVTSTTSESLSDAGTSVKPQDVHERNEGKMNLCNFLVDIQKYTTPELYNEFKFAIKKYSKDQDLEVLVVAFSSICCNLEIFTRIKAFRNFIRKEQRSLFDEHLKDLRKSVS